MIGTVLTTGSQFSCKKGNKHGSGAPSTESKPIAIDQKNCSESALNKKFRIQESLPLQSAFCLDLLEKNGCPLRKLLLVECLSVHPERSSQLAVHLDLLSRRDLIKFE